MLVAYDLKLQIVSSCICQIACEFKSQATNIWRSYSNTPIDVLSVIDIARSFFLRTVRRGCLKYFSACKNDGTALRLVQNLHTVPGLFRLFFCYVLSQQICNSPNSTRILYLDIESVLLPSQKLNASIITSEQLNVIFTTILNSRCLWYCWSSQHQLGKT